MKRFIVWTFALLILATACGPNSGSQTSKHLLFNGIPLDGPLQSFIDAMIVKGYDYKYFGSNKHFAQFRGDFVEYRDCIFYVYALKNKDLVYSASAIFENQKWDELYGIYSRLKEMLTEKYGEPSFCVEEFTGNSQPRDGASKIREIMQDRCNYRTKFTTEKGSIILGFTHNDTSTAVILQYFDKINYALLEADRMSDL